MKEKSWDDWADRMMDYLDNKGKENWSHEDWELYYEIEEGWSESDEGYYEEQY